MNEKPAFSRSSKNINPGYINEKMERFPKINIDRSYVFPQKKSSKKLNIYSPPNMPNIRINKISSKENNFFRAKKSKNSHISPIPSLTNLLSPTQNQFSLSKKNNNLLQVNYLFHKNPNNNMNKTGLSIADTILRQKTRNSMMDADGNSALYEQSGTNLKLVEKELQFKLLDMSMNIDYKNSDDEDSYNFSNINNNITNSNDNTNKFWHKNVKNELESCNQEIKMRNARRNSVNVNDIKQIYNLNNFEFGNRGSPKGNKTIIKGGLNSTFINKLGTNNNHNISTYRDELNKSNMNGYTNNRRRKSLNITNGLGLNWMNNMSFNRGNKSMYMNVKNNASMNKTNISFNNKTVFVNKNNLNMSMNINRFMSNAEKNREYENKFRVIKRNKELYDSFEDEEVVEELEEDYIFISPETRRIFTFDILLLFSTLFSSFFYPIFIAKSTCFCSYIPLGIRIVLFFNDFLNIFDILICFFRAYYNFEFTLIKKNEKIVKHYLKKYFVSDLIVALPVFSFSHYLCSHYNPDGDICFTNGIDLKYNFLKGCLALKIIKIFKVMKKKDNRGINYFYEKISENFTLEKTMKMMLFVLLVVLGFNIFICFHIYMGRQNYPNWIIETNNQDKDFINLYLVSLYFLITTITSVGYGDITCVSLGETIFQIILLTIGVIAYSWVVSTIGNYVKKETRAAIKYNKDIGLLEEIRISYPKMSFKLYNKIHKHLETVSHQQERFDTKILVNNLPYTLKNKLMFIIYENIINKFIFFKDCQNSDFIIRVLTSFIPLSAKKGAFIIHEGELVDNIIFVKEGRLSLVAAIDLENPLISIDNYLGERFEDINEKMDTKVDNSMLNQSMNNIGMKIRKAQTEIKSFLKTKDELNESKIELEIGKRDFDGDDFDVGNHQFLNILDILKNEHYGEVYMFLQKPSPLSLRVKSKYSDLFLLRKHEAMAISRAYPNVWKKIYHKSYHNMKSIKNITKHIIVHYCQNYGHKYDTSKPLAIRTESDNFLLNLGILNSKSRNRKQKKIKFDLDVNNSNKNVNTFNEKGAEYPKKSILKKRVEKHISLDSNQNNEEGSSFQMENKGFIINVNGSPLNKLNNLNSIKTKNYLNQMSKMRTMTGNLRNNNFRVPSKNKLFPNTITIEYPTDQMQKEIYKINKNLNRISNESLFSNKFSNHNLNMKNMKNKFSNKKINITNKFSNNTININTININNVNNNNNNNNDDNKTIDLNCTSKLLSNYEDNNNNNKVSINNNKVLKKMNSNVAVRCNSLYFKNKDKEKYDSNTISGLSFKAKNSANINNYNNPLEKMKSIQIMNDTNINDTKIIQNTTKTHITQKIADEADKTPNTIKNLSRPLIKKIQKKIKKRQKKKKLYKMLISKISESLSRINPNSNLTILNSSMNNSLNNSFKKNDINNYQLGNNFQNSIILQDNSIASDKMEMNEGLPFPGQELLIIPESPEFDSESSSENSKSSNESNSKSEEVKKKVELTISENNNFSYNKVYDNLNIISEGNYSKDVNLQKSVMKLIGVYLKEKTKSYDKSKSRITKNEISENNLYKKDKEKEKEKERSVISKNLGKKDKNINSSQQNKDKKKEEDVWAFLNEDEHNEHEEINFKLDSSSSKSSSIFQEKNYSKTPKGKFKRNVDFTTEAKAKSRFKKNNSNINGDKDKDKDKEKILNNSQSVSPNSIKKKDFKKKKSKKGFDIIKLKKCTTIISPKKTKNKMKNDKNDKFKSNKEIKLNNKLLKKNTNIKNENKDNDSILNSLDLSMDNLEQDSYIINFYKTCHKKKKDDTDMKNSNSLADVNSSKVLKDK